MFNLKGPAKYEETSNEGGQELSTLLDASKQFQDPIAQIAARIGQLRGFANQDGPAYGPQSGIRDYAEAQIGPLQELLSQYMESMKLKNAASSQSTSQGSPPAKRGIRRMEQSNPLPRVPQRKFSYGNDAITPSFLESSNYSTSRRSPLADAAIRFALQYLNKRNPHRISSL